MNTYVSLFFIYACVTLCSTEKQKESTKPKDEDPDYSYQRPTFKTKEDIPKEYIDLLTEYFGINEDPLAEIEGREPTDYYDNEYQTSLEEKANSSIDTQKQNSSEPEMTTEESPTQTTVIDSNATESSTNATCKVCEIREDNKNMRIQSIKRTILHKLGFSNSNLPNVSRKIIPRTPSFEKLVAQYEMQGDAPYGTLDDEYLPEDQYYGQIHRAFTVGQQHPDDFGIYTNESVYFDIPQSVRIKKIQDATLWIYLDRPKTTKKRVTQIVIYLVPEKSTPAAIPKNSIRYSKTTTYGWQEFKFAHIVHHWVKKPRANKGLIIEALDDDGTNLVVFPTEGANEEHYPTLEMATTEHKDKHHRNKRSAGNICSEAEQIDGCCRYPLRVDFVEFGWDWVIAPTGYRANYCSGECLHRHMDDNPNAYLVQQNGIGEGSGPCCTPNKFFPLAMLYFDHAHTVLYTYMQKMIVVRCGCA